MGITGVSAARRGAKGSQQAAGQAKSDRSGAGGGAAGGRGGRRKDRSAAGRNELLATEDDWLDGEGTAPDVLR